MPHYSGKNLNQLPISDDFSIKADIVLVGAGMSSLYLTWQLLKHDPDLNIVILEQLDRTGGRLDSDVISIDNFQVKEEQGGMRFTFDTMDALMALIQLLGLEGQIVPFPMNSGGNNRLYFRGTAFTTGSSQHNEYAIWSELYHLEQQEQYINPKQIINTVFNRILDVNPQFTERPKHRDPGFWQRFRLECAWKGKSLVDWQLQGLLSDMGYSTECINLLYRLLGFNGTFLSTMNAGVAYQLLEDFPADPKFKTFKEGFSTLPNAIIDAINAIQFHGLDVGRIALKTMVNRIEFKDIDQDKDKEFLLHFTNINEQGESQDGVVAADKVILGLPRLALERLFVQSNVFNILPGDQAEALWNTLESTSNQPLLKINFYYDKAWWGNKISGQPPVDFGPNFSDMPLGSVYPFYAVSEDLAAGLEYAKWLKDNDKAIPASLQQLLDSKHNKPAALTIYCDYMNINFWKALQNQGGNFPASLQSDNPELQAASTAVVEQATAFFKKLFNTHYVPEPVLTSARIWSGSTYYPEYHTSAGGAKTDENASFQPYGFGVHQWALGAQDDQVMRDLVKPIKDVHLYTCGEAYSDYQGWVEGALRSANLVLKHEDFQVPTILDDFATTFAKEIDPQDPNPANTRIKRLYWDEYVQAILQLGRTLDINIDPGVNDQNNPYLDDEESTPTEAIDTENYAGIKLTYKV